ncbi:uncharacterized protein LOC129003999 [Macrosteles quadrilineatus]|nr:uncharacterized protein LOC128985305 [Macrosteles quadrilineatus]XP_054268215.1 uncharacterized protein LOC128990028 [Macrosteles quadrilineatus]XP_054272364.1 uncharacterized protein LOC128992686 [Macrosteles quadrilineatus]XP_054273714.1 uncharacterized protein LOC128993761 [Macrosteles quadrilineatus]XP_054278664.1 uncharacterized protein LOC128997110 [Macrosteles quadrilineatus]XP_054288342.1 uncharacterized protein LOC129003999 [Macrosteles quadrilineatus]
MALAAKLNTLEKGPYLPKIDVSALTNKEGYSIVAGRAVNTKYGASIVLDIHVPEKSADFCIFLPKRFSEALSSDELKEIAESKAYRVQYLGMSGNSPNIKIWKQ